MSVNVFVWVDPPGPHAGWAHEVPSGDVDALAAVLRGYDIPADNAARAAGWNERCEVEQLSPAAAQRVRDELGVWGVTVLDALPDPLPDGLVVVPAEQPAE